MTDGAVLLAIMVSALVLAAVSSIGVWSRDIWCIFLFAALFAASFAGGALIVKGALA